MYCGDCRNWKCRCDSCYALAEKDGKWYCENAENYCESVTECLEYEVHEDMECGRYRDEV